MERSSLLCASSLSVFRNSSHASSKIKLGDEVNFLSEEFNSFANLAGLGLILSFLNREYSAEISIGIVSSRAIVFMSKNRMTFSAVSSLTEWLKKKYEMPRVGSSRRRWKISELS